MEEMSSVHKISEWNVVRDHIIEFSHIISEKPKEAQRRGAGILLNPVDFGVLRQAREAESAPGSMAPVTVRPLDHLPLQFLQAEYVQNEHRGPDGGVLW